MGSGTGSFAVFFFIIFSYASLAVTVPFIGAVNPVRPNCTSERNITTCVGGIWPLTKDFNTMIFPKTSKSLELKNIIFLDADLARPLPALSFLRLLTLTNLTSFDAKRAVIPFPFERVTAKLNRSGIIHLYFDTVNIGEITGSYFNGFSGLKLLFLDGCILRDISPQSFYPLATSSLAPSASGVIYNSTFTSLFIRGNKDLTTFPWNALLPVANSIKDIIILNNNALTELTFPTNTSDFPTLKRIQSLIASGNRLTTLHPLLLESINGSDKPHLDFMRNVNQCSVCDELLPLLTWIQAGNNRILHVTCKISADGTDFRQAFGNSSYFKANPDCGLVPTSPTTPATSSFPSTAPTLLTTPTPNGSAARLSCVTSLVGVVLFGLLRKVCVVA